MIDLTKAKEDAEEALDNIGKLSVRISTDEGRRLVMLTSIVYGYIQQLEGELSESNND
jgi:hypothetical protein